MLSPNRSRVVPPLAILRHIHFLTPSTRKETLRGYVAKKQKGGTFHLSWALNHLLDRVTARLAVGIDPFPHKGSEVELLCSHRQADLERMAASLKQLIKQEETELAVLTARLAEIEADLATTAAA